MPVFPTVVVDFDRRRAQAKGHAETSHPPDYASPVSEDPLALGKFRSVDEPIFGFSS